MRAKRGSFPYLILRRILLQMKTKRLKKNQLTHKHPYVHVSTET